MNSKKILTIPNIFSFLRIFLVFPIFYFISIHQNTTALIFIAIAFITDILDGFLARRFDQVSEVGKILDPVADKICTAGGFVALTLYQGLPWWITFVILGRDILITMGSILLIGRRKIVIPSNYPGKLTVFLISIYAIAILLNFRVVYLPLLILVLVMLAISFFYYLIIFIDNLKNEKQD